jgi:hypothetical protein
VEQVSESRGVLPAPVEALLDVALVAELTVGGSLIDARVS